MVDMQNKDHIPTSDEISAYIANSAFDNLRHCLMDAYHALEKVEYSRCTYNPGWNVKYRKAGRTLCTVYPETGSFTALVVVGSHEKPLVEAALSQLSPDLQAIYAKTREGNGQRWLMIPIKRENALYHDTLHLIHIRNSGRLH